MIEGITLQQIIEILVVVGAVTGALSYAKIHLSKFTAFIVALNEALADDKVTNEEYAKIWNTWLSFVAGFGPKPVKKV